MGQHTMGTTLEAGEAGLTTLGLTASTEPETTLPNVELFSWSAMAIIQLSYKAGFSHHSRITAVETRSTPSALANLLLL